MNLNFGNDDAESLLRDVVLIPHTLTPLISHLQHTLPTMTSSPIITLAVADLKSTVPRAAVPDVLELLQMLCDDGALSLVEK